MFLGQGMADGNQEHERQADEADETGERLWGGDLGPNQGEPEASALGITDLFFDGHAAIIERDQITQGVVAVGGQPPGFPASSGPDADNPDSDDGILAQLHPAEVDGLARLKATFPEQAFSRFIFHHHLVGVGGNQKGAKSGSGGVARKVLSSSLSPFLSSRDAV